MLNDVIRNAQERLIQAMAELETAMKLSEVIPDREYTLGCLKTAYNGISSIDSCLGDIVRELPSLS